MTALPLPDRIEELLVEQALYGLSVEQARELSSIGESTIAPEGLERAAAAIHLAIAPHEPMPDRLRARLYAVADAVDSHSPTPLRFGDMARASTPRSPARTALLGWLAAAAAVAIAIYAWTFTPSSRKEPDFATLRARPDAVHADWSDWDHPEISGVTGEVVWSEKEQRGYMKLKGLPLNNSAAQQYQLWIIDRRGLADASGQSARVSGGIFDATESELIIPITPAIPIRGAAAFAITIEEPGGTWVSTMKRRVCIASLAPKG